MPITTQDPVPNPPTPGALVCVSFTATGSGSPSATVTHGNGDTVSPNVTANAHPQGSYTVCFTWPNGNTTSDVTISVGGESTTVTVVGTGGP